jgi:arylsulfatase A-like enzyme
MLLTGKTLYRCRGNIAKSDVTLPDLLADNGYATFITGKWHNAREVLLRAFESGNAVFHGGMGSHFETPMFDIHAGKPVNDRVETKFDAEVIADAAARFIGNRPDDRPFFAFVSFLTPHDPRKVPNEYHRMYDPSKLPLPPNFAPEHPFDNGDLKTRDELLAEFPRSEAEVRQHIADYYAATTATDAAVGRVLDALEQNQLSNETIVVFAGDNGLAVGQHGLMGKQSLYEHSIRVPLIMRGPGIPRGKRLSTLCLLSDVYPTIASLAGMPVPSGVDSLSLLPALHGETEDVRQATFHVYRDLQRAVRTRDAKLIEYTVEGNRFSQVFDLHNDPLETCNLADDPEHASLVADLRQKLKRLADQYGAPSVSN